MSKIEITYPESHPTSILANEMEENLPYLRTDVTSSSVYFRAGELLILQGPSGIVIVPTENAPGKCFTPCPLPLTIKITE